MKTWKMMLCAMLAVLVLRVGEVGVVYAHTGSPTFTTWSNGNTLTATALNNNFSHIHTTLTGGITDSNLAAGAALQHSKLAAPSLVPKAWAIVGTGGVPCVGGGGAGTVSCVLGDSFGISNIKNAGTSGSYTVTLNYTASNVAYAPIVSAVTSGIHCSAAITSTTVWTVACEDHAGTATDAFFSLLVMDT